MAFSEDYAPLLRGCSCWCYLGNNNFLAALVRGDSNTEVIAVLVDRFWKLVQRYDIRVWFSRVRSKLNPAYLPTRKKNLPFSAKRRTSFKSLRPLYALPRVQLSKYAIAPTHRIPLRRQGVKKGTMGVNRSLPRRKKSQLSKRIVGFEGGYRIEAGQGIQKEVSTGASVPSLLAIRRFRVFRDYPFARMQR